MNTRISPSSNLQGNMRIPGDNPIRSTEQDVLQRAEIAEKFAHQVCRLDTREGAVVGVFGPWGSGKTSFIHLARKAFEDEEVPVLDFNPWLFSGAEQLVERFVTELSAELKLKDLEKIGDALLEYGDLISGRIGMLAKIFGTYARRRGGGIQNKRDKVAAVLRDREKPIIVVLDDVDRLSAPEIREIFKLVRLTASFPNLVYIVCCDRQRVEQALGEETAGLSGRDYLEKIIQLPFELPEVPEHLLAKELHGAISDTLAGVEDPGPMQEGEWPIIFDEIIRPLVRNMRDVRRYAIAIRHTLEELGGQVARNDVLALEAVRLFLPGMFRRLPRAIEALTMPGWFIHEQYEELESGHEPEPMVQINKWIKSQVEAIIAAADDNDRNVTRGVTRDVANVVVDRLFPAGEQVFYSGSDENHVPDTENEKERLDRRRVAHEHILRLYLERVMPPNLQGNRHADHVISLMGNREGLQEYIHSLKPPAWHGLIHNLDLSGRKFSNTDLENLVIVLLGRWSKLPNQLADWILLDRTRTGGQRIIRQILGALENSEETDPMVSRILTALNSLSSRLMLVELLRSLDTSGTGVVPESALQEYENMLRNDIVAASSENLADECDLSRVLYYAKGFASDSMAHTIMSSRELTITVLLSALMEKSSSVLLVGFPIEIHPELDWDGLVKLYGNNLNLVERIRDLKASIDSLLPSIERRIPFNDFQKIMELVHQYLLEKGQLNEAGISTLSYTSS